MANIGPHLLPADQLLDESNIWFAYGPLVAKRRPPNDIDLWTRTGNQPVATVRRDGTYQVDHGQIETANVAYVNRFLGPDRPDIGKRGARYVQGRRRQTRMNAAEDAQAVADSATGLLDYDPAARYPDWMRKNNAAVQVPVRAEIERLAAESCQAFAAPWSCLTSWPEDPRDRDESCRPCLVRAARAELAEAYAELQDKHLRLADDFATRLQTALGLHYEATDDGHECDPFCAGTILATLDAEARHG